MTRSINLVGLDDPTFRNLMGDYPAVVHDAIGYLSLWGYATYPKVSISWSSRYRELLATYERMPGNSFTMGGIWREDEKKFSFHS